MIMSITSEELRENKNGMFATKETGLAGYEYAEALLKAEGVPGVVIATALSVYSNSLLDHLARVSEEES
jgi:hypothetical protein